MLTDRERVFKRDNENAVINEMRRLRGNMPESDYDTHKVAGFVKPAYMEPETLSASKNIVFVLGNMGAGKSTLTNYLQGAEYKLSETDMFKAPLQIVDEAMNFAKTSSNMGGGTTVIPQLYNNNTNFVYVDFPGFEDDQNFVPECPLAGSLAARYLSRHIRSIKAIIVVTNLEQITENRGKHFLELMRILQKAIKDIRIVQPSLFFLINKLEDYIKNGDFNEAARKASNTLNSKMTGVDGLIKYFESVKIKEKEKLGTIIKKIKKYTIIGKSREKLEEKLEKLQENIKNRNIALMLFKNLAVTSRQPSGSDKPIYELDRGMFANFIDAGEFREQFESKISAAKGGLSPESFYLDNLNVSPVEYENYLHKYITHMNNIFRICNSYDEEHTRFSSDIEDLKANISGYERDIEHLHNEKESMTAEHETTLKTLKRELELKIEQLENDVKKFDGEAKEHKNARELMENDEADMLYDARVKKVVRARKSNWFFRGLDAMKLWHNFDFDYTSNGVALSKLELIYEGDEGKKSIGEAPGKIQNVEEDLGKGTYHARYNSPWFSHYVPKIHIMPYVKRKNHPQTITDVERERNKENSSIGKLNNKKKELNTVQTELAAIMNRLSQSSLSIEEKESAIRTNRDRIDGKKQEISNLERKIKELTIKVVAAKLSMVREAKKSKWYEGQRKATSMIEDVMTVIQFIHFVNPKPVNDFMASYKTYHNAIRENQACSAHMFFSKNTSGKQSQSAQQGETCSSEDNASKQMNIS